MPEAVNFWIENKNVETIEKIQDNILQMYQLDFAKHAPEKDLRKISQIWFTALSYSSNNERFSIFIIFPLN